MQAVHTQIDHGTLTGLHHLVFHLLLSPSLPPPRYEPGGYVRPVPTGARPDGRSHDEPGRNRTSTIASGVSSTTISIPVAASNARMLRPFTTDDTAFDLVRFDMEHGNRVLDSRLRRHPLDGLDHDLLRLLVGGHLRLLHDLVDVGSGLLTWPRPFKDSIRRSFASSADKPGQSLQMLHFTSGEVSPNPASSSPPAPAGPPDSPSRPPPRYSCAAALPDVGSNRQLTLFQLSLDRLDLSVTGCDTCFSRSAFK